MHQVWIHHHATIAVVVVVVNILQSQVRVRHHDEFHIGKIQTERRLGVQVTIESFQTRHEDNGNWGDVVVVVRVWEVDIVSVVHIITIFTTIIIIMTVDIVVGNAGGFCQ